MAQFQIHTQSPGEPWRVAEPADPTWVKSLDMMIAQAEVFVLRARRAGEALDSRVVVVSKIGKPKLMWQSKGTLSESE